MGKNRDSGREKTLNLAVFLSDLGWIGLVGQRDVLSLLTVGHESADKVRQAVAEHLHDWAVKDRLTEADWHPSLRRQLECYCAGIAVDFADVKLQMPVRTPFQTKILAVTRRIKYGQTMSYGELAAKAGFPRAARAVGTVMSSNRFPIIIPCHRVVASGGALGGYSSPHGVCLKQRLLDLEAESFQCPGR